MRRGEFGSGITKRLRFRALRVRLRAGESPERPPIRIGGRGTGSRTPWLGGGSRCVPCASRCWWQVSCSASGPAPRPCRRRRPRRWTAAAVQRAAQGGLSAARRGPARAQTTQSTGTTSAARRARRCWATWSGRTRSRAGRSRRPRRPRRSSCRERLLRALEGGARRAAPADAAAAQVNFDCWLEELESIKNPANFSDCKDSFVAALAKAESALVHTPYMVLFDPGQRPAQSRCAERGHLRAARRADRAAAARSP